MAKIFLDTSAFVKLYKPEIGSTWLPGFVLDNEKIISQLTLFEISNTITRLFREGYYSRQDAIRLLNRIVREARGMVIVSVFCHQI
jgi:predicted nucleic acid-binding protein